MGPIGSPETSVGSKHYALRNISRIAQVSSAPVFAIAGQKFSRYFKA